MRKIKKNRYYEYLNNLNALDILTSVSSYMDMVETMTRGFYNPSGNGGATMFFDTVIEVLLKHHVDISLVNSMLFLETDKHI